MNSAPLIEYAAPFRTAVVKIDKNTAGKASLIETIKLDAATALTFHRGGA